VGVRIVTEGSGTAFDPEVVEVFKQVVAPYPAGMEVRLSDGRHGIVSKVPAGHLDCPIVRVTHDEDGFPLSPLELPLADNPGVWIVDCQGHAGAAPAAPASARASRL
jgi:hypothetical protein